MSSSNRKQRVKEALASRAINSGVPQELWVYELDGDHSEAAVPRSFVPRKVLDQLRAQDKGASKYQDVWPLLLQEAIDQGTPIELVPDDSRMYRHRNIPLADFCIWGIGAEEE